MSKERIRIMNITNGDEVNNIEWETKEEAEDWIENQDIPEAFTIMN